MGQRVFITEKDWLRINRHYNCSGAWDEEKEEIKEYSKQEEDDVDDEEQEFEIVGDSEDVDEEYGENGEVLDVDEEDEELIKRLIAVQLLQMKK